MGLVDQMMSQNHKVSKAFKVKPRKKVKESAKTKMMREAAEKKNTLLDELKNEVFKIATTDPEWGFENEKEVIDFLNPHFDISYTDDGMTRVEVRGEFEGGYDFQYDLAEKLNHIVQKYDPMAYFDLEEPGIISAYLSTKLESLKKKAVKKKAVKKKVKESVDEPYVYTGGQIPKELKDSITKVVIADGVDSIKRTAFSECHNLKSIVIPDTVDSIGPAAFEDCTSLESVILPKGLEEIRAYTFAGCKSLREITIPKNVAWIAMGAFADSGLQDVKILSKNLEYIADDAFEGCIPLLDGTKASFKFDFGAWCEKTDNACKVED